MRPLPAPRPPLRPRKPTSRSPSCPRTLVTLFDTSDKGGETAIKELGGTYAEVGPAEATPDAQVSYINTLTQQQVGAIVISANDKQAVCDALTEARDAGVKVVTLIPTPIRTAVISM